MPYVAQNGVCCGFRANFVAEATKIANSSCRCHISVASEFRVGDLYQESPLPTSDPAPAVPTQAIKSVKANSLPGTSTGSATSRGNSNQLHLIPGADRHRQCPAVQAILFERPDRRSKYAVSENGYRRYHGPKTNFQSIQTGIGQINADTESPRGTQRNKLNISQLQTKRLLLSEVLPTRKSIAIFATSGLRSGGKVR